MTKRSLALLALVAALVVGGTVAQAAGKTQHKVNDTVQLRVLMTDSAGNVIETGTITDKRYGAGAVLVTIQPAAPGATSLSYTATAFYKRGTLTGKGTTAATKNPDGSFSYAGDFTATRGTGVFKGASGKATITGTSPANDNAFTTLTLAGTFTY